LLFATSIAATSLLVSSCAGTKINCSAFNRTFDQLQAATATAAAAIVNRGVCHSQIDAERRAQCPEYYVWLANAKTFASVVAVEKSGCMSDAGRAKARQDFIDLEKSDAFPAK
jgi:hypothetical protein